jgi:TPR repeat protein
MNNRDDFALVRKPSSAVEKAAPGAKCILSDMVADTLAVAIGQLESWYRTGDKYYFGKGVPKNYTEAAKWFLKAAERGHKLAQNGLGVCYEKGGYGFSKDYSQAVKWYRMAAEQGEAYAQNNLGACYANGIGVSKDRVEAVKRPF